MKVSAWTSKQLKAMHESLWFVPVLISASGLTLALVLAWVDRLGQTDAGDGWYRYIRGVQPGASSAESLSSTAMAALATILGVAYSLTIVTLQLAATQYTSRLLRRFMADRLTRAVLGLYLGTIAYLALVLRSIKQPSEGNTGFVPGIALGVGLLLFLSCMVMLAVFIHHLARSIQSGPVIASVGRDTIRRLRLHQPGQPADAPPALDEDDVTVVTALSPGYLQLTNEEKLLDAVPQGGRILRMEVHMGQFILAGRPLLSLSPARPLDDETLDKMRGAVALGAERTVHQDALYGVRQLVDVALKALSPAVNDVHTAVMVVNELGAVCDALIMSEHGPLPGWREVRKGEVRLFIPRLNLPVLLSHAFDELPRAAMEHPVVIARLLEILAELASKAPDPISRAMLVQNGLRAMEFVAMAELTPSELSHLTRKQSALARARLSTSPDLPNPI